MQIQFEGWARNHGIKTMLRKTLKDSCFVEDPFPLPKDKLTARKLTPDEDMADGIRVYFSTDMRLGGDQMGTLTISTREIFRMARAAMAGKTVEQVLALLQPDEVEKQAS